MMSRVGTLFLKIIFIVVFLTLEVENKIENKRELTCDSMKHEQFQEGNLGQSGVVPWLGVIRAHVHIGGSMSIAVTGAILVKPRHAIANADDMSKIRKKGDSKAMFISRDRGPWTCKLSEVLVHPEYEFATYSTVALVELDTESLTTSAPMLPICPPSYMYNTSNELYALGFTDEHKLLEKIAYKVQYVEKELCDEYYKRAGHANGMYTPLRYECAFAVNALKNCDWENGMALASNTSGYWVLVGISVQGPGCSAPARFIDINSYMHWIDVSSDNEEINADYPFKVKVRRLGDSSDLPEYTHANETNFLKRGKIVRRMGNSSVLLEHTNANETRKQFLKREKIPLKISFQEFLKEREFPDMTQSLVVGINQKNETLDGI